MTMTLSKMADTNWRCPFKATIQSGPISITIQSHASVAVGVRLGSGGPKSRRRSEWRSTDVHKSTLRVSIVKANPKMGY